MLDVFKQDAFGAVELTDSILKAPYKPSRIGSLGLFRERGMRTKTAVVEEKDGQLSLIQTSPRGGPASTLGRSRRTARSFEATHLERESTIFADEVQGVRAFGSEDATESVQAVVNERLADLRAMHEVTLEHHRIGAIKGLILDADGSEIFNLFTEFGVAQQTFELDLASNVRNQAVQIQRMIEDELGASPVSGYRAFCGDHIFDEIIAASSVLASLSAQESQAMRVDLRKGFDYGGITWENYRGNTGGTDFVADGEAYIVPEGTNIFTTYFAPADFMEAVNTIGLPLYAKLVEDKDLNRWVKIHSQSNPLALCLRPRAVVKVTFQS